MVTRINYLKRYRLFITIVVGVFLLSCCLGLQAATYNLTSGSYPPCNTSWSVSGTTYTCNGNGRVTLASGDILTSNTTITISADNGFVLTNNTIGSSTNRINLVANYGAIQSGNTNTIYGNITANSSDITLINTSITGTVTTGGNINLTGGAVTGKITSSSNTITTNGTNLSGGAQAQSGMSITGGTIAGAFVMTANNTATFSGVTMTSGSISGASSVTIQSGSVLGSGSNSITISSNSGPINVNNSTVYGNLTAPNYSTVNITNGGAVYGTCAPNSTPANACNNAATQVNHYRITHSGTGITCEPSLITIRAYNSLGNLVNPPNGTVINLSTLPATGTWSPGNSFTFNGTTDTATLYLRQITPATLNINISGAQTESASYDPSITFVGSGLRFYGNSSFAAISTQVAGSVNNDFILRAIRTDNNTGACVAQTTGMRAVNLAYECRNPVSCISGQELRLNNILVTGNANNAAISYQSVTLNFNNAGVASIPFSYTDVGLIRLHAQLSLTGTAPNPTITLTGISDEFVVKPHTLAVTNVAQTESPFTANPGTTGSGSGFIPAAEKFTVSVQSRNASGTATPNFGNEILVGGLSAERNKIQLQMGCPERDDVTDPACTTRKPDYPTGGSAGELITGDDTNGDGIVDAPYPYGSLLAGATIPRAWSEVGSFRLEPSLSGAGYLGAGDVEKITPSGLVGRFYPNHFTLLNSTVTSACAGFTYMGQNFTLQYRLEARNKNNGVTTNYHQLSFSASSTASVSSGSSSSVIANAGSSSVASCPSSAGNTYANVTMVAENDNNGVDLSARISAPTTCWIGGVRQLSTTANASFARQNSTAPDGPFDTLQLGLRLTDSLDSRQLQSLNMNPTATGTCAGAACTAITLGTAPLVMRYGRVRLEDAFGPETSALPVNFLTEYWVGNIFIRNNIDSCTTILRSAITYPSGNIETPANLTVALTGGTTAGTTTGQYGVTVAQNTAVTATNIGFATGSANHSFSTPTSNATGSFTVSVNLAAYPWLRFDWNQDGNYSDTSLPPARYTFGSYRGHDRVIYWRERFQ